MSNKFIMLVAGLLAVGGEIAVYLTTEPEIYRPPVTAQEIGAQRAARSARHAMNSPQVEAAMRTDAAK